MSVQQCQRTRSGLPALLHALVTRVTGRGRLCALLSLLFLAGLGGPAHALVPQAPSYFVDPAHAPGLGNFPSPSAACAAYIADSSSKSSEYNWVLKETRQQPNGQLEWVCVADIMTKGGVLYYANDGRPGHVFPGPVSCPANSTSVTGGCQCASGFSESGGQCVEKPDVCKPKMNSTTKVNWTIGWTRTPNDTDRKWIGGAPSVPSTEGLVCVEGCKVGVNLNIVGGPFRSQEPSANGLYRTSADFEGLHLGSSCETNTTAADKNQPIAPCPGFVGEVEGKTACVGTAAAPLNPVTASIPVANDKPPVAGNPAAGEAPKSGEGSGKGDDGAGRTPAAGAGGNAGGPAAAAAPGKGGGAGGSAAGGKEGGSTGGGTGVSGNTGGTVDKPGEGKEQAACGAPGQPVCDVNIAKPMKIDEGETKKDMPDSMKPTLLDEQMQKKEDGLAAITDSSNKDTRWGILPQWFSSVGCQPFNLGTIPVIEKQVIIDICKYKDYVDGAMAFIWITFTFFAILSMVLRVTTGASTA